VTSTISSRIKENFVEFLLLTLVGLLTVVLMFSFSNPLSQQVEIVPAETLGAFPARISDKYLASNCGDVTRDLDVFSSMCFEALYQSSGNKIEKINFATTSEMYKSIKIGDPVWILFK